MALFSSDSEGPFNSFLILFIDIYYMKIHRYYIANGKLAFWFMVMAWVMEYIVFQNTMNYTSFPGNTAAVEQFGERLLTYSLMGKAWLMAAIFLIIWMLAKKETKGKWFIIAVIGTSLMLVLTIVATFIGMPE